MKRLCWFVLSALAMAAAGLLARRLSTRIWQKVTGEAPPTPNY